MLTCSTPAGRVRGEREAEDGPPPSSVSGTDVDSQKWASWQSRTRPYEKSAVPVWCLWTGVLEWMCSVVCTVASVYYEPSSIDILNVKITEPRRQVNMMGVAHAWRLGLCRLDAAVEEKHTAHSHKRA